MQICQGKDIKAHKMEINTSFKMSENKNPIQID